MKLLDKKYIYLTLLAGLLFAGCSDDDLLDNSGPQGNPNAITFSALVENDKNDLTRGAGSEEENLYDPLVLNSPEADRPLYLHTYESKKIGFNPGEEAEALTRGNQITSADELIKFHTNFKVFAAKQSSNETYIDWVETRKAGGDNNVWHTDKTEYWPGEEILGFNAVSPASEFNNLKSLTRTSNSLSFSYEAKKGSADKDAEAQCDLLLASSSCNKSGSTQGKAPLHFYHGLSAVKFAIRDVLGGEVVNIKISGVNSKGDCVFTNDASGVAGSFVWSNQSEKTTFSQNFNYKFADRYVNPSEESQDLLINSSMPEKTFMMIPQQIPEDAEIIVTLKRNNLVGGLGLQSEITVKGKIRANNVSEWKAGHEYVYTISTSKDNWVYVLTTTGNHRKSDDAHGLDGDMIYVYEPTNAEFLKADNRDKAYMKVTSYRYRANNMSKVEALPWKASHGDAVQYRVVKKGNYQLVEDRDIPAEEWITSRNALYGPGSSTATKYTLTFQSHSTMSTWDGDKKMQDYSPFTADNSPTKPWDLSTCGGNKNRYTANTYVIDREGWYCFPLIYGNAIKNNKNNTDAYKLTGAVSHASQGKILEYFRNHNGENITAPQIPSQYYKSADVIWSDVYNAITQVQISKYNNEDVVLFHVNKFNIQQGNVIIAIYDSNGAVAWSWQIWITEHWINPNNGYPHFLNNGASYFNTLALSDANMRDRGDLEMASVDRPNYKWYVAPYNVGWCDPKNVDYLRRPGTMKYVQYQADGVTPTGKQTSLEIVQDGIRVSYEVGNNSYYQFGRKDPLPGFHNFDDAVKATFGSRPYALGSQTVGLKTAIQNPNIGYCASNSTNVENDDWCSTVWLNLWNNSKAASIENSIAKTDHKNVLLYNGVKTVYDPCPPGYMVPPAAVFKNCGTDNKGSYISSASDNVGSLTNLNGKILADNITVKIWTDTQNKDDSHVLWLTSTGNRWYTSARPTVKPAGGNFNPQIVYLWSSNSIGVSYMSYGLALGYDASQSKPNEAHYCITPFFDGRRSMARPVRPIREDYTAP